MGCAASKQAAPSYPPVPTISKPGGLMRSWYNPLPRSVSTPIHNHSIHPQSDDHDDPAVTGSFVRLLYRKKLSTSSVQHNSKYNDHHHHQQRDLGVVSGNGLDQFLHGSSYVSHNFCGDGCNIGSSLQQPQLARLRNLEVHRLHVPNGAMESVLKEGLHDQDTTFDSGISFQYPERSTTVPASVLETGDDRDQYGGDEQGWKRMNGMEDGRRDYFITSRDTGVYDVKREITMGKSLSFNTYLDTQTGSLVLPTREAIRESGKEVQEKPLELSDLDATVKMDVLEDNISVDFVIGNVGSPLMGFSEDECPLMIGLPLYNLSSPLNDGALGGPKLDAPVRSPSKSPVLSSKSLSSPLFDPSLLALFEQAAEGMCHSAPMDGWILDSDTNEEPSTSLSSSGNHTWISSEDVSSDADSLQYMNAKKRLDDLSFESNGHLSLDETWLCGVKRPKVSSISVSDSLEMFELRFPPRGEDKVVLYFTSLRGIRRTYQDCHAVRFILQGLGVDVDERDVWMHMEFREELVGMLGHEAWPLPRLFIGGRYIGGAEKVMGLHEDGVLAWLVKDLPLLSKHRRACDGCADMRFVPCLTCHGSRKLMDCELDSMVRCMECNENGLIMCPICRS